MVRIRFGWVAHICVLQFFWIATQAAEVPGSIPGEFSVGRNGDAQYRIPINVAPGAGGLAPELALEYSSSAGAGLAGQGLELGGIGAITRCRQTLAQDGQVIGVTLTSTDRFCLNGQRLIVVAGSYGDAGSEYRTEIDRFYKITANGSAGSGPESFTVRHPDGMTYTYGDNASARLVNATGTVKEWGMSLVEDKFGNRITVYYQTQSEPSGNETEYVPIHISYSDPHWFPQYKIELAYENRPARDYRSGYLAGAKWEQSKRLQIIKTYHDTAVGAGNYQLVHTYTFAYETELANGTGRSRLESLTLCGPGDCLPPTEFDWQRGEAGWEDPMGTVPDTVLTQFGDFNRDGKMDVLSAAPSSPWYVYHSNGSGFDVGVPTGAVHFEDWDAIYIGIGHWTTVTDYNGDGRDDHLYIVDDDPVPWWPFEYEVGLASSSGTFSQLAIPDPTLVTPSAPVTADIDGDGLADLIQDESFYYNETGSGGDYGPPNALPLPPGMTGINQGSYYAPSVSPIDINADGKSEVLANYFDATDTYWYVSDLNAGTHEYLGMQGHEDRPVVLDINGDGLTDFLIRNDGDDFWSITMGTGSGFTSPVVTPIPYNAGPPSGTEFRSSVVVDYDLDGRSDILDEDAIFRSNGNNFDYTPITTLPSIPVNVTSLDVTGEGNADLVYLVKPDTSSSPYGYTPCNPCGVGQHNGAKADLLIEVMDGHGKTFQPNYVSLSNASADEYDDSYEYNYPIARTVRDTRHVVSSYDASDGIGGSYNISFKYYNGKQHLRGRGFMGFSRVQETDSRNGVVVETDYETGHPFVGRVGAKIRYQSLGGNQISSYDPEWLSSETYTGVDFVYLDTLETRKYEVGGPNDGELITITTEDNTYNLTYGYLTSSETKAARADWPSIFYTTTKTVTPFSDSLGAAWWCLGLPAQVDETRQNPWEAPETRSTTYSGYQSDCKARTITEGANAAPSQQLVTALTYDTAGNIETRIQDDGDSSTPAEPRETRFNHDDWNNRVTREERVQPGEDSYVVTTGWNLRFGLENSVTDVNLHTTTTNFDNFGRPTVITRPDGATSAVNYQFCAAVTCNDPLAKYRVNTSSSDGSYGHKEYDTFARELGTYQSLTAAQATESFVVQAYDDLGRVITKSAPGILGQTAINTVFTHDLLDRVIQTVQPLDDGVPTSTIVTSYEKWIKRETRNADTPLAAQHDALGRMMSLTDAAGVTWFKYTAFDDLKEVNDVANNKTTIQYNERGFRTYMDDPDSGEWTYTYNAFGELRFQTDDHPTTPQVVETRYDRLGRMIQRLETEGTTTWEYYENVAATPVEKRGLLEQVSITQGATELFAEAYDYDSLSRLSNSTTSIDGRDFEIDRTYDSESRLQTLTYPEAEQPWPSRATAVYSYDGAGKLDQVTYGINTVYELLEIDGFGNETKAKLGNEYRVREFYAATGLPKTIRADLTDGGTAIQNLEYAWYSRGNLRSRQHSGTSDLPAIATEDFYYDEDLSASGLDRVTSVRLNGTETLRLTYDVLGNITSKSDVGILYKYGESGAGPHAVTSIDTEENPNDRTYSYDHNGNVLSRELAGNSLQWTSFNKPSLINYAGATLSFSYGPDRARYRQVDGAKTIYYIGNLFQVELEGSNVRSITNVFANGQAVFINQLQSFSAPGGWLNEWYLHRDHLGSVDTLTDGNGNLDQRFSYDAFGKRRNADWTADTSDLLLSTEHETDRGYTGHEHLDRAKLIHMNGRVNDPVIGRFLSVDPVVQSIDAPQGLNRYSYVFNNPLTLIDPSGFAVDKDDKCANGGPECGSPAEKGESPEPIVTVKYKWDCGAGCTVYGAPTDAVVTYNFGDLGSFSLEVDLESGSITGVSDSLSDETRNTLEANGLFDAATFRGGDNRSSWPARGEYLKFFGGVDGALGFGGEADLGTFIGRNSEGTLQYGLYVEYGEAYGYSLSTDFGFERLTGLDSLDGSRSINVTGSIWFGSGTVNVNPDIPVGQPGRINGGGVNYSLGPLPLETYFSTTVTRTIIELEGPK
ncbi:MAG: FG-GAP-like repeat-containing protein [Gammaproteobacteria bacterium]|nr:FG-GAP-like repeat-containing protein [Gammaproteobacteria bacterium]MDP6615693.1 FG-GAP-like repeat-containing protein [Gammaproteobacteria bacterium]MDP6695296.1 FG-GAP-like repeat-containing protein [Gammaproteobacteria bacterium]